MHALPSVSQQACFRAGNPGAVEGGFSCLVVWVDIKEPDVLASLGWRVVSDSKLDQ